MHDSGLHAPCLHTHTFPRSHVSFALDASSSSTMVTGKPHLALTLNLTLALLHPHRCPEPLQAGVRSRSNGGETGME